MLTKKEVLKSLKILPNQFEIEQVIEKIVLLEKIRIGMEQSNQGKVQTKEQVKKD